jgi:hypothetical protein
MHALQWQWSYDKDLREPSVELAGYMFINKLKHKNHTLIKDTKDLGAFTPNYISNQQWSMSSSRTIKPSNCTIVSGSLIEFGLAPKSQIPLQSLLKSYYQVPLIMQDWKEKASFSPCPL